MKLSDRRSIATIATSPVSSAPRPSAPARQCMIVPPAKCPPVRTSRISSADPMAVTGPRHDGGMRPRDERAIVAMQIDRHAAERLAPVGDRAVVMRMRDGDRLQAAERADVFDGLAGRQRDAIPHHAAIGRRAPAARAARSQNSARRRCRECRDHRARRACDVSPSPRAQATSGRSSSHIAARPRRPGTRAAAQRFRETARRIVRKSIQASASLQSAEW